MQGVQLTFQTVAEWLPSKNCHLVLQLIRRAHGRLMQRMTAQTWRKKPFIPVCCHVSGAVQPDEGSSLIRPRSKPSRLNAAIWGRRQIIPGISCIRQVLFSGNTIQPFLSLFRPQGHLALVEGIKNTFAQRSFLFFTNCFQLFLHKNLWIASP